MYMETLVDVCDGKHITYSTPRKGAALLKEDNDGCWTIISYVGPEYIAEHDIKPMAKAKVRQIVEAQGGFLME